MENNAPGVVFVPEDKVKIALALDEIGVYEIEVGIYSRATEGRDYILEIMEKKKNSNISLWARLRKDDVLEACRQKPDILHIGVPVSYAQIYSKLNKNKQWILKNLAECMEIADNFHVPVVLGFEDCSRADLGFMIKLIACAEKLGVSKIRLSDTVGIFTPERAGKFVKDVKSYSNIPIETHEHNDLGLAVANSIEMANAGAEYIDCTLYGLGERAGNCDMYEFVNAAELKYDTGIDKKNISKVYKLLENILKPKYSDYLR